MSDTHPNQSVLPFPGELRNMIYRNLVKKTYLAISKIPESQCDDTNERSKRLAASAGLVILRVSKATSMEALKILYEESVFLFELYYQAGFHYHEPSQRAVDLMYNVSFIILGNCGSDPWTTWERQILRAMGLFTGTERLRNVMRIRFIDSVYLTRCSIPESFDGAMIDLGGFRKLVVEFESRDNPGSERPWLASEQALAVSQCENFKDYKLEDIFEPAYGPALQGALHNAWNYICYLEFYPRQHSAKKLIAKAAQTLEEAARLAEGNRTVASLLGIAETLKLL